MILSKGHLTSARHRNPAGLRRLARWLKLRTEGMSERQVVNLVWWLITRREKKERGLTLGF